MSPILARALLDSPALQLLETLPDRSELLYDDGVVVNTPKKYTVMSRYFWEYHRRFPNLPILHTHTVWDLVQQKPLSADFHIDVIQRITKDLFYGLRITDPSDIEAMAKLAYECVNTLLRELMGVAQPSFVSVQLWDFLSLARDPKILEAKQRLIPSPDAVGLLYEECWKSLESNPQHRKNPLMQMRRSRLINSGQFDQVIVARGYATETSGQIYSTPIIESYTQGLKTLGAFVMDSRGAAKHLEATKVPLEQSEYAARRFQLVAMTVDRLANEDCQSTDYFPWVVRPPIYGEHNVRIYPGDLTFMRGKWYWDNGVYRAIEKDDPALYGKTLQLRSPLTCKHPDPRAICFRCFGDLAYTISPHANLGHLSSTTVTQIISQMMLKTKHLISSAVGSWTPIPREAEPFIAFYAKGMQYRLKPTSHSVKLMIQRNECVNLTDYRLLTNRNRIDPRRISQVSQIFLQIDRAASHVITVPIAHRKTRGYFTREFLNFAVSQNWETTENGNFVFDMRDWNPESPILTLPNVEYSLFDHAMRIAETIESSTKRLRFRARPDAPFKVLAELFELINTRHEVHISLLETLMYCYMSPSLHDTGLARGHTGAGLHVGNILTRSRSLAPAFLLGLKKSPFTEPSSFYRLNRPDSPLDYLFKPESLQ